MTMYHHHHNGAALLSVFSIISAISGVQWSKTEVNSRGNRSKRRQVGSVTNKTATRWNGDNLNGDNYSHNRDRLSQNGDIC